MTYHMVLVISLDFRERTRKMTSGHMYMAYVKIVDGGLYFIFPLHFILLFFSFFFTFLFLEQLGLGLIGHAVTSVTS